MTIFWECTRAMVSSSILNAWNQTKAPTPNYLPPSQWGLFQSNGNQTVIELGPRLAQA
jgi:hypothetical protein